MCENVQQVQQKERAFDYRLYIQFPNIKKYYSTGVV